MSSRPNNTKDIASGSTTSPTENSKISMSSSTVRNDSTSRQEQASSAFRQFLHEQDDAFQQLTKRLTGARQQLTKYTDAYAAIEQTMDRLSNLNLTVSEKNDELERKKREIERLNSIRQAMHDDYENRYDKWKLDCEQLQARIEELKSSCKKAQDRAELAGSAQTRLKETEAEMEVVVKKLRKADDRYRNLRRQFDECSDRLKEWDEYTSVLENVDFDTFRSQLSDIFTRFCEMMRRHFLVDLPVELLNNHNEWDKVTSPLRVPFPLPTRNSLVAQQTRMIAALHIVATHLHKDILKPCFLPRSTAGSETLKEILGQLFREDPRKEVATRALLISAYADTDIDREIERTVAATSSDVLELLRPLLNDTHESFYINLTGFLHDAAHLWKQAQRSTKKIDATIDNESSDICEWDYLEEFDSVHSEATGNPPVARGFAPLSLFPCIYVPENEENPVLQAGCALWSEQAIIAAAEFEHRECMAERRRQPAWGPVNPGASTKRRRPSSAVANGSSGSIASSPTSPTTRRTSFLEKAMEERTPKDKATHRNRGEG